MRIYSTIISEILHKQGRGGREQNTQKSESIEASSLMEENYFVDFPECTTLVVLNQI